MEQFLTQLAIEILFDDSTGFDARVGIYTEGKKFSKYL